MDDHTTGGDAPDAAYDAVVYDLDGTLVQLTVNWAAVAADVLAVYAAAGVDPDSEELWHLLAAAERHGIHADVEATICRHERRGAERSRRLRLADAVADRSVPIGVCSLNCEAACRIALDVHGVADHVDAVVGRDSVATHKPDPEPLLATLNFLGVAPEDALFVGDSPRDEETAERAGVAFEYV
jgi:phosphoglycolate phosphatase